MTIVNNKGSKIRTTVSLTKIYSGIAMFRFVSALGTSAILRRGTGDLPGISVVAGARAMRILKGNSGIIKLVGGSHSSRGRRVFTLSNVFIRVNLATGDALFGRLLRAGHVNRVLASGGNQASMGNVCTTKSMASISCGRVIVTVKRNTGTTLTTFRSQVHKAVC